MKDRIKQIRNSEDLNQAKFADDLGVSVSNIQSYETGRRIPSEAFIKLLCNKYNVNEEWLRTGSGEMFAPKEREEEIADLINSIYEEDDPFKEKLIKILVGLTEEDMKVLKKIILKLAELANEENLPG